jgi:hypothetical protein
MPANLALIALAMFVSAAFSPVLASAQESENKVKIQDVTEQNQAPGEDVDEQLTNKQLRALSGSKSKYSISTQFNYTGGTIQKPIAEERPNISGAATSTDVSGIVGDINGKYNIDQRHSVMAGFGVRYVTPFYGTSTPKIQTPSGKLVYNGDKVDADNPYLQGQYIFTSGKVQNIVQLQGLYFTATDRVNADYVSQWTINHYAVYEVGTTGLTLGIANMLQTNTFNTTAGDQNDLTFNIDPYLEYRLNDTFNLRTVTNLWNYDHVRAQDYFTWDHNQIWQSVGVGISITRDIFIYPNAQFLLENIRADQTNVALNTFINIF